ncbi:MAG TPA: AglZ/HisF2 family acetamidino modification protein [Steroidobacteraceae bacterium]|nr:AglZ/HisF2 family acetamidino modification protein [Steroidobacteraceae bacterium]
MSSLRPRLIPCLQVADGSLCKTRRFKNPIYLGDPINAVRIFNDLDCDELIVVDIRATIEGREPDYGLIEEFASEAFMPLAYGGGIDSIEQIRRILSIGIEKVVIGSAALEGPLISEAAAVFGSQSIVVAIDARKTLFGRREVYVRSGTQGTGLDPCAYAADLEQRGAGELFVQSIDLESTRAGYDLDLMTRVSRAVRIPVIACGGAGTLEDIRRLMHSTGVAAAAAGTMFVLHGKHNAPLISYPRSAEIVSLARSTGAYSS